MIAIEAKSKIVLHIKIKQNKPNNIFIFVPPFSIKISVKYGTGFIARKFLKR